MNRIQVDFVPSEPTLTSYCRETDTCLSATSRSSFARPCKPTTANRVDSLLLKMLCGRVAEEGGQSGSERYTDAIAQKFLNPWSHVFLIPIERECIHSVTVIEVAVQISSDTADAIAVQPYPVR